MVGITSEQESHISSKQMATEEQREIAESHNDVSNFEQDEGLFDLETDEIWKKVDQNSQKNNSNSITRSSSSSINRRSSFRSNSKKKKNQVLLEGYVEVSNDNKEDDLMRTKSLTDDDLDELKGCLDLGFGFSYDEIPELCNTLPALELCYSMSQKFLDEQNKSPESNSSTVSEASSGPIANWKISSPGWFLDFCSLACLIAFS